MYLKQLEINGFKSFLGKIELSFTGGINAIVGPNGSGKSNIADAIRWVIGEQSVKTLRGSKMEDIIFSGSEKMKAAGFAEVTLIIENSDKGIDLDFNEISITRRMFRSGESEYYINKAQCRLKDITEMFLDTGVGKDGYSIIGQGKIDEILSNKSDDRRAIFEEAAGISKYKYRKLEAEKKMEHTEQNIIRIKDILQEIENQLEPLFEQAKITKTYQKLLHELKVLDVNLIVTNIDKSNNKLKSQIREIESLNTYIENNRKHLTKLEDELNQSKAEIKKFDLNCSNLNQKIYELINLKDKNESELSFSKERTIYIESLLKKLYEENKEAIDEKEKIISETEKNKTEHDLLENKIAVINDTIKTMESEYNEKYSIIIEMENNIEVYKEKHIDFLSKQSEKRNRISVCNETIKNLNNRISQLNIEIDSFKKQYEEKLNIKNQIEIETKRIKEEIDKKKETALLLNSENEQKKNQVNKGEELLTNIKLNKENIYSRLKLMEEMSKEYDGYNKTIKNILTRQNSIKNIVKGYRGVVGELITVPEAYSSAIEAGLGMAMQNIVTDYEEDAKRLIDYLKSNNMGRATFLPLSAIKPRQISPNELRKLKIPGFIGVASDLVKYDAKFNSIFYYLLGRIAVVDNINTAIKLGRIINYEIKTVTLEGDVISVGGAITGGSKSTYTGSVLTRKNRLSKLKKEYDIILKEFEKADHDLIGRKNESHILNDKIMEITEKLQELNINISNKKNEKNYLENELDLLESRIEINNKDIEELEKEKDGHCSIIDEKSSELGIIEKEDDERVAYIKILEEKIKAGKTQRDDFINKLTGMKVKEAELKQQRSATIKILDNLAINENSADEKISNNIQSVEKAKNDFNEIKLKESELNARISSIEEDLSSVQSKLKAAEEDKIRQQDLFETIESRIKNCGIETTNLQNNLYKLDLQKSRSEMEIENLEYKLLDTYELSYNKALSLKIDRFNISQSTKRIEELKEEIKDLGTVNVSAIEEYERLNSRYSFLKTQLNDLITAKDSLTTIIEEITDFMKNQFLNEFEIINKNFNEVFKKLFGGGMAQVVLNDKDNVLESGIDIIVKPPNKKQQNLMLMSGGERALTAIALLFGILIMKPIPFCVLDEIDSALDDTNVIRYANYLKELSKDLQFIIITHRKGSMEAADCLYGVSMEDTGASVLLSVKLEDKVS